MFVNLVEAVLRDSEQYTREERLEIAFGFMRIYQGRADRIISDLIHSIPGLATGPEGPPLAYAAKNGYNHIVQTLLDAGAEVNAQFAGGWTALMFAAGKGHDHVVQTLIRNRAEVNVQEGNLGWTALMIAANQGHDQVVQTLIQNGADLNAQDSFDRTALMRAAGEGHNDVVKTLLIAGADVNVRNYYGSTALMYAERNGHTLVVQTLRRHIEENEVKSR